MDAAPPSLAAFSSGHTLLYPQHWSGPTLRAMATQPAKGGRGQRQFPGNKASPGQNRRCRSGPNRDMVGGPVWACSPGRKKGFLYCQSLGGCSCTAPKDTEADENSRVHTGLSDHDSPNPPAKTGGDPGFSDFISCSSCGAWNSAQRLSEPQMAHP